MTTEIIKYFNGILHEHKFSILATSYTNHVIMYLVTFFIFVPLYPSKSLNRNGALRGSIVSKLALRYYRVVYLKSES